MIFTHDSKCGHLDIRRGGVRIQMPKAPLATGLSGGVCSA